VITWEDIDPNRSRTGRAPWRETFHEVKALRRAHIRYRRSAPPPPFSYAVTLEVVEEGKLHTVRLWDNADSVHEHHEHIYTRGGGKQDPLIMEFASPNEAMAAAIAKAKREAGEMVRQWQAS